MGRRWLAWAIGGALVALVAYAPFRDTSDTDGLRAGTGTLDPGADGPSPGDGGTAVTAGTIAGGASSGGTGASRSPGGGTAVGSDPDVTDGSAAPDDAPDVPDLPEPTEKELAVLGPLIAAMDTGQRAGTPLVLGIATSIVATGLPSEGDLPPELRPVLAALGQLIATPGAQVNDLTAQNSVQLAALDRALGELAFANPALNATIHQTADLLAAMGRAAEPVSPPGAVSLGDLSILLTYFAVE